MKGRGGPRGANEIRDWVKKDPIAWGFASPLTHWPFSIPYVEEKNILHIFWRLNIFYGWGSRKQPSEVTVGLARETLAVEVG